MKRQEAIKMLSELVVTHKNDIVDIINEQKIGSLTYTSDLEDVNSIVLDNLENQEFLKVIDDKIYEKEEFCYEPISLTVAIIAAVIVVGTGVKIAHKASLARKERRNILRENRRSIYLTQEELDEIAMIEREALFSDFLIAQNEYLQREEIAIQQKRDEDRKNILTIVVAGIFLVIGASYVLKRK